MSEECQQEVFHWAHWSYAYDPPTCTVCGHLTRYLGTCLGTRKNPKRERTFYCDTCAYNQLPMASPIVHRDDTNGRTHEELLREWDGYM